MKKRYWALSLGSQASGLVWHWKQELSSSLSCEPVDGGHLVGFACGDFSAAGDVSLAGEFTLGGGGARGRSGAGFLAGRLGGSAQCP